MAVPALDASTVIEPIRHLAEATEPGVLAVITAIEGPSYRPLGAMMAILADGQRIGTLSSGCIEADIGHHALHALEVGSIQVVKYGKGSPFADIQLPCGGGLEITLIPCPETDVLRAVCAAHARRAPTGLTVDQASGVLIEQSAYETGRDAGKFHIEIAPEIFFYVFGKGPEAVTFGGLVQSAGYPNLLLSPDTETLSSAARAGCETRHLTSPTFPQDLTPDAQSAVLLFFHDHEWEPPILQRAVKTPAFYIGAQGSQRAAQVRRYELSALGLNDTAIARIRGPIGLIPSVRDARKLAVSVLAEVLDQS